LLYSLLPDPLSLFVFSLVDWFLVLSSHRHSASLLARVQMNEGFVLALATA